MGYDTIYAHQDKEDDLLIGVRSSALKLGKRTRPALYIFYALTLALLAAAGVAAGLTPWFLVGLGLAAVHLAWQAATLDIDEPGDCLAKFKSNFWFGLIILARRPGGLDDAVAGVAVVDMGPGQPGPFGLRVLQRLERSGPGFVAAPGDLVKVGIGVFAAHDPIGEVMLLARLLEDVEADVAIVDIGPGLAGPLGLGLLGRRERPVALLGAAAHDLAEGGVGVFAADDPVALHARPA